MGGGHRRRSKFKNQNSKNLNEILEFEEIISLNNLLLAWQEFVKGKRGRRDVQEFSFNLMDNIISLHQDLSNHTYKHGGYQAFNINDPKPRSIHKAGVRDRLLHRAIYRVLYPFFDKTFISDSFSCRINKGTHKALNRFRTLFRKVSQNDTRTCWVMKCDIKKFFENIDHAILIGILERHIPDQNVAWLAKEIISSFCKYPNKGLPLGNLTSQLFVNSYMNEFDRYAKHILKAKYYIRYADDFLVMSRDKDWLHEALVKIGGFLSEELKLQIHPNKIFIRTISSGVDFLGWVHFPDHRVLRTATKRRMIGGLKVNNNRESRDSYLGLLKHGNTYKIKEKYVNQWDKNSG
ncbi:MAG: Retron-type reverse transcriptase [Candidatus Yanofskybacteria bacterium GW2011_GWA2_44_9]|uniref:Retron-type reverse transcriptase n=1 Tax=Candidatus Yanofskybacteria bacterium GW2011_GWA2_44_9 TaxID=1619025 RepID=A0A0G1KGR3_9BACT|nr:MAG: Retron-type reverse transcriptase [Candidatus Yanofskybacteria bacterium GW2011_GWA2_44_9]